MHAAKRPKELDAAQQLFTPDAMRNAYDQAESACEALEQRLDGATTGRVPFRGVNPQPGEG